MKYRTLGKSGLKVSEVSLGTWQVGGRWGEPFDERNAKRIIERAIEGGVSFIDTADVYSDGRSEHAVAKEAHAEGGRQEESHGVCAREVGCVHVGPPPLTTCTCSVRRFGCADA